MSETIPHQVADMDEQELTRYILERLLLSYIDGFIYRLDKRDAELLLREYKKFQEPT